MKSGSRVNVIVTTLQRGDTISCCSVKDFLRYHVKTTMQNKSYSCVSYEEKLSGMEVSVQLHVMSCLYPWKRTSLLIKSECVSE